MKVTFQQYRPNEDDGSKVKVINATSKIILLWGAWCFISPSYFNSLTNDKSLDWSRLRAIANDKINVTEISKFVLERVESCIPSQTK